jgi:hypothetical protein
VRKEGMDTHEIVVEVIDGGEWKKEERRRGDTQQSEEGEGGLFTHSRFFCICFILCYVIIIIFLITLGVCWM